MTDRPANVDAESQPRASISIGGSVEGQNVLIGSSQTVHGNLSIRVGPMPGVSEDARQALQDQIARLIEALENVPGDRTDDVKEVRLAVEDAVAEAENGASDGDRLRMRGTALKRAAERLADIAPSVLAFATQIAATIAAFA